MVRAIAHLNAEDVKMELSENSIDFASKAYRTLFLGSNLSIFIRDDQLELLFDLIDVKLHDKTYLQQEDEIFSLTDDLDAAKDIIEYYRELKEEGRFTNV